MAEITVLKHIADTSTQQRIFMKLVNTDPVLLLKDKYDRTLPLRLVKFEDQNKFVCKGAVRADFDFSYSENYTAHLTVDNERYMFEADPVLKDGQITLEIKRVFQLQNRQTVRYKVPNDSTIKLIISSVNEESVLLDCRISDLNSTGCSVIVNTPQALKAKDILDATLIIGKYGSVQLQGVIRNVRPNGPEQFAVGVEFHHLMYSGEDKLTTMISELHQKTHLKSS